MCGISGLIHRDGSADIGSEMTRMLQSLRHRGRIPPAMRFTVKVRPMFMSCVLNTPSRTIWPAVLTFIGKLKSAKPSYKSVWPKKGAELLKIDEATEYACRLTFKFSDNLKKIADYLEDIEGVEIMSIGRTLELVKDLGDANTVSKQYTLNDFRGTHAIGHTRMATESAVDIRSAHPYGRIRLMIFRSCTTVS